MANKLDPKLKLRSLCKDYIWYKLIGPFSSGEIEIEIADRRRRECHLEIIALLDQIGWGGTLRFFYYLDELGFPTEYDKLADVEQWEEIARIVGNKAYEKLAKDFYPDENEEEGE